VGRDAHARPHRAAAARCAWNSKEKTRPCGATARASDVVSEPLPVPLSSTSRPGASARLAQMLAMSGAYRICVRCRSTRVHSAGVGRSSSSQLRPSLPTTRAP
jgi:hypothetical protein